MDANDGLCFPYDVLLCILRRLPGDALANSRCVCPAWRAMVDAHSLLLPHAFPRTFPGIYMSYFGFESDSAFFAPLASTRSQPPLPFVWHDDPCVQQHCNGLLLIRNCGSLVCAKDVYVCNPATRRCDHLPPPPMPWPCDVKGMFLAFDPAESRHHRVFLFPRERMPPPWKRDKAKQPPPLIDLDDEKPQAVPLLVFSSRTGEWESREFMPAGRSASGKLYRLAITPLSAKERRWWSGEYRRGSMYVHCCNGVLMILRCAEGTYDTVQLPGDPYDDDEWRETWVMPKRSIAASYDRGLYYTVILDDFTLRVWALSEPQLEWKLWHQSDLHLHLQHDWPVKLKWRVVETDNKLLSLLERSSGGDTKEEKAEEELKEETEKGEEEEDDEDHQEDNHDEAQELGGNEEEGSEYSWNSNEDNFVDVDQTTAAYLDRSAWGCSIVGLHPYKDVLLLDFNDIGLAFHLETSKMQYLGDMTSARTTQQCRGMYGAFPYRPCYIDALATRKPSLPS